MTPDGFDLHGLDGQRPLPPGLAERLEAALTEAAGAGAGDAAADTDAGLFASLDAPRPLPEELSTRLETAILASSGGRGADRPVGAQGAPSWRYRRRSPVLLTVAAVLALLLGALAALSRDGGDTDLTASAPGTTSVTEQSPPASGARGARSQAGPVAPEAEPATAPTPPAAPPPGRAAEQGPSPASAGPVGATAPAGASAAAPPASAGRPADSSGTAPATAAPAPGRESGSQSRSAPAGASNDAAQEPTASDPPPPTFEPSGSGAPPPYAFGDAAPPAAAGSQAAPNPAPSPGGESGDQGPAPAPPPSDESGDRAEAAPAARDDGSLRIGVVGGDSAQEATFRAYVDAVNAAGGIDGRRLELVTVTPGTAAPGTLVTVNLSRRVIAGGAGERPEWVTGALLETLTATEASQPAGGAVRSFAGAPERLARLLAAELFPAEARGATAIVFTSPAEPWRTAVPAAIEAVLEPLGVAVKRVAYDPDRPPALFPTADAAFLSLDAPGARSWVRHARVTAYRPGRGVGGLATLHDESLLPDLPDGTRVMSPYALPPGAEGEAIRSAAGSVSAAALHGWATAKMVAVALWQTGAATADETAGAFDRIQGYESGLFPPYQTRGASNARLPDGLLYQVRSGAFAAQGGFRRDP